MKSITDNEMLFVLSILKNPEKEYNSNNIAKILGISSMGALKIAKRLENEKVLLPKKLGKAVFYSLNLENDYVKQYIKFLLKREAEQTSAYLRRWIIEIKKISNADCAILFGSIIKKHQEAKDVDVLFITDSKKFPNLKREINEINIMNDKKIHPLYQTDHDLKDNIKKHDKPILNAIKGIVVFGEDKLIELIKK